LSLSLGYIPLRKWQKKSQPEGCHIFPDCSHYFTCAYSTQGSSQELHRWQYTLQNQAVLQCVKTNSFRFCSFCYGCCGGAYPPFYPWQSGSLRRRRRVMNRLRIHLGNRGVYLHSPCSYGILHGALLVAMTRYGYMRNHLLSHKETTCAMLLHLWGDTLGLAEIGRLWTSCWLRMG